MALILTATLAVVSSADLGAHLLAHRYVNAGPTRTDPQLAEAARIQDGGVRQCGRSNGARLCVSVPDVTLRGTVTVTTTVTGWPDQVRFSWGRTAEGAAALLTAFGSPWALRWPTAEQPDGSGYLVARAYSYSQGLGDPVSIRVTVANGRRRVARPDDWAGLFQPRAHRGDPVVAAVGDSGDGTATSSAVASLVRRSPADVLLYLGDIYETGTAAEWETNFGQSAWSDGSGSDWGRLVGFTQPVLGNHEAHHPDVWRRYWHGRPLWSTFVYGGVRFLLLDSDCDRRTCDAQLTFARRTLAANRHACVVAAWHRPVLSPGPRAPWMAPLWRLVASHGGDLVLNGHQHHMQVLRPLNGALAAGQRDSHLVQIVSGAGGHILHRDRSTDPRGAWQAMGIPGALFLTLVGGGPNAAATRLTWAFRDTSGRIVSTPAGPGTGSVTC